MTRIGPLAALILCCAFRSDPRAAPELRFAEGDPLKVFQSGARVRWDEWERRFGFAPGSPVDIVRPSKPLPQRLAGRSRLGRIELSPRVPVHELESIFSHELAHEFVRRRCTAEYSPLFDEALAQYLSGDDRRLSRQAGAPLALSASLKRLHRFSEPKSKSDSLRSLDENALARVLRDPARAEPLRSIVSAALRDCGNRLGETEDDFRALLFGSAPSNGKQSDGILWNAYSRREEWNEGHLDTLLPVASILKAIWLAEIPELSDARVSRFDESWNCPRWEGARVWQWDEALAHSCNGFFLDTERGASPRSLEKRFRNLWQRHGWTGAPRSMAEAIGVLPNLRLSPRQVLKLYQDLVTRGPTSVLSAMKRTFVDGTLSEAKDAAWFLARGMGAKTGTLGDENSAPRHAWLVVTGPLEEQSGRPNFILLLHGVEQGTRELLGRAREILERNQILLNAPAKVQVLSLFRDAEVRWSCSEPGARLFLGHPGSGREKPSPSRALQTLSAPSLSENDVFDCDRGPLLATIATRGAHGPREFQRRFWGQIEYHRKHSDSRESNDNLRPRQIAARNGSAFWLRSSEREYVLGVLAAEYPRGRAATLAALAFAVRRNLANRGRHADSESPPCDTTHCQVFAEFDSLPGALRRRLVSAYLEARRLDSLPETRALSSQRDWFEFSLGGDRPWQRRLSSDELHRALGHLPSGDVISIDSLIVDASFSCERLRETLRFPSCPQSIRRERNAWIAEGIGEGHGLGLDLQRADQLAAGGADARSLLRSFYFTKSGAKLGKSLLTK